MRAEVCATMGSVRLSSARRSLVALLLGVTVAAGCGELGEPNYGIGSITTTTALPAENDVAGDPEPDAGDPTTDASAVIQVFTPPRPDGYEPSLLISTQEGISVADVAAAGLPPGDVVTLAEPLGSLPSVHALDDYFGGLVVQSSNGEIRWYRDTSGESVLIDTGGRLLDVGFLDETFQVYVFVAVDGVTIDRIRLSDLERTPFIALGAGEELLDLSASRGLQAVVVSNELCGDLVFFDALGAPVDVGGPGEPICLVSRRPVYGSVALPPDAASVAYTELSYRSDGVVAATDIVVRELGTEAELFRAAVGGPGDAIDDLAFDGRRLVFVRQSEEAITAVTLDIEDPTVALGSTLFGLPLEGVDGPTEVSLARQPLAVGR